MKKLTKKDTTTTKTKSISKGTLTDLAKIQKAKKNEIVEVKKVNNLMPLKNTNRINKTETTKTKSSKVLIKSKDGNTVISAKEEKEEGREYVMIEKSVTVKHTSTTFLDDDEEDELFNEDWFGGTKLKKQKQAEDGMEEEDLDTIMESFGKDDDKYW
jgi:hypothetical protein